MYKRQHDGYAIEERIKKETASLGIREEALYRPVGTLSYGEQTKIMLASLFLKTNYFLLIDEPTNHLDADGRAQLADYMKRKKGFILVSHDRYFLNQVIDHVPVSYTHLDVYKRQAQNPFPTLWPHMRILPISLIRWALW